MDSFFPNAMVSHGVDRIGFVLTTWPGDSLTSHAPRSLPSRLAILSLFILSGYYYTLFFAYSRPLIRGSLVRGFRPRCPLNYPV